MTSSIREACEGFGAEVVMTSSECVNGTERCAEAHAALGGGYDIVVNLQGDAPLTPHWFIEDLITGLRAAPDAGVATPVLRCDGAALNGFLADRKAGRVGGTTAVFAADHSAIVFFQGSGAVHVENLWRYAEDTRCFTMWVSMRIARMRWRTIPVGPSARSSSWRGWNSCGSWKTAAPFCVSKYRRAGGSSGS